jgi:16S rRNA (adenine1518-N6/adenine1519-N6)-dimethyltransferase
MLRNTLAGLLPADALAAAAVEAGLSLQQRPQELAPERWVALATSLNRAGGAASPASASSSPSPAPSCS